MDIGSLWATIGANITPLKRDLLVARTQFTKFSAHAQAKVAGVAGSLFSLKSAFLGLGVVMGARVFKSFLDFGMAYERTLSIVQVVSAATAKEMELFRKQTQLLGETTEFTATQAAEALRFLSMAGLEVVQSMEALPIMLDLATAGQIDLGRAADISTNIMSQMGLQVRELTDVNDALVAVQATANTTIEEAAQAFIYAGAKARDFSVDVFELSGLIGILANSGIKATMAGTTLRQSMIKLLSPTTKAEAILKKYKIAIGDGTGAARPFVEILKEMADAQLNIFEVTNTFGARAGNIAVILRQGAPAIQAYIDRLRELKGIAEESAAALRGDVKGAFDELRSALQGKALQVWSRYAEDIELAMRAATESVRGHGGAIIELFKAIASAYELLQITLHGGRGLTLDIFLKYKETIQLNIVLDTKEVEKEIKKTEERIASLTESVEKHKELDDPATVSNRAFASQRILEYTDDIEDLRKKLGELGEAYEQVNEQRKALEGFVGDERKALGGIFEGHAENIAGIETPLSTFEQDREQLLKKRAAEDAENLAEFAAKGQPGLTGVGDRSSELLSFMSALKEQYENLANTEAQGIKRNFELRKTAINDVFELLKSQADFDIEKNVDFILANELNKKIRDTEEQHLEAAKIEAIYKKRIQQDKARIKLEETTTKSLTALHDRYYLSKEEAVEKWFLLETTKIESLNLEYKKQAALLGMLDEVRLARLEELNTTMVELSQRTSDAMEGAFSSLFFDAMRGELDSLEDYFRAFLTAIQQATSEVLAQIMKEFLYGNETGIGGLFGKLLGGLVGLFGSGTAVGAGGGIPYTPGGEVIMTAKGAYVTKPTLAVIGEAGPEYVLPEKKLENAFAKSESKVFASMEKLINFSITNTNEMGNTLSKDNSFSSITEKFAQGGVINNLVERFEKGGINTNTKESLFEKFAQGGGGDKITERFSKEGVVNNLTERFGKDRAVSNTTSKHVSEKFRQGGIVNSTIERFEKGGALNTITERSEKDRAIINNTNEQVFEKFEQEGSTNNIAERFVEGGSNNINERIIEKFAQGGVINNIGSHTSIERFAKGGIVNSPTIFPMANGAGLMGEAGPEGILPLTRMPSGALGVQSREGTAQQEDKKEPDVVNVYIQAMDSKSFADMMDRNQEAVIGPVIRQLKGGNTTLRSAIRSTR